MNWEISGVYGDTNMPNLELSKREIFGIREFRVEDIEEAIEKINTIRSGKIEIDAESFRGEGVEVYISSDGETYHKLPEDLQIGEVGGTLEKIKIKLRSSQADLFPDETINIKEIRLELSNKPTSKSK